MNEPQPSRARTAPNPIATATGEVPRAILVTGGAGYLGSFTVRALLAAGERVIVADDLSTGDRDAVPDAASFVQVDLRDGAAMLAALADTDFDCVVHLATATDTAESMTHPRKHWVTNLGGTMNLLSFTLDCGVRQFVFRSSCAVYGDRRDPSTEDDPRSPATPLARTMAATEQVLEDYDAAYALRSFRLRCSNPAGAAADGSAGDRRHPPKCLIPRALHAALTGEPLAVFGTDWPTADGSCVRDFTHVEDLARGHLAAVSCLRAGHPGGVLNLTSGIASSVHELVAAVRRVTGRDVPWRAGPRRRGDTASVVAFSARAADTLGWTPQFRSLDSIVATAWEWARHTT